APLGWARPSVCESVRRGDYRTRWGPHPGRPIARSCHGRWRRLHDARRSVVPNDRHRLQRRLCRESNAVDDDDRVLRETLTRFIGLTRELSVPEAEDGAMERATRPTTDAAPCVLRSTEIRNARQGLADALQDLGFLDDLGHPEAPSFGDFASRGQARHDDDRKPWIG